MTELRDVLDRLGLLQYLGRLKDEGFHKWDTVLDITEQDLAALDFKLGHRRILQREIASARGIPPTQALTPAQFAPVEDFDQEEKPPPNPPKAEPGRQQQAPNTGKRKYRRHPKTDGNAPEKPPSAYVMFANSVRDELKGRNLTFTQIAKLVGDRWKVLEPEKRELYEYKASAAKDKFNAEFEEYKKTDNYRDYVRYLADFKSKLVRDGKETPEQFETNMKRPKLESASGSQGGTSDIGTATGSPVSMGSVIQPSLAMGAMTSATLGAYSPPSASSRRKSTSPKQSRDFPSITTASTPLSPPTKSVDFAGFRESTAGTTQHQQQEALTMATTDAGSHFLPRIHATMQNPHIQQQSSYLRHQPTSVPTAPPRASGVVLPSPGMRRREDTFSPMSPISGSISSSGSSTAALITPITPIPSGLDENTRSQRALPLPSPSSTGYFDQRAHHQRQPSQPQSPRYGQTPLPLPTIEHHSHSRSYSSTSSSSLPAPTNSTMITPTHQLPPPTAGPGPNTGQPSEQ